MQYNTVSQALFRGAGSVDRQVLVLFGFGAFPVKTFKYRLGLCIFIREFTNGATA